MQIEVEIPVQPEAVAMARDTVSRVVAERQSNERVLEDLRLMTSEIVTNALRHSGMRPGDSFSVAIEILPQRVRVEVADHGPGFDPRAVEPPAAEGVGGWGLFLVDKLADRWGVVKNNPSFVWFELDLSEI
jgi:anti-sigma regulatory factor (Ser/Thr protein kinase)